MTTKKQLKDEIASLKLDKERLQNYVDVLNDQYLDEMNRCKVWVDAWLDKDCDEEALRWERMFAQAENVRLKDAVITATTQATYWKDRSFENMDEARKLRATIRDWEHEAKQMDKLVDWLLEEYAECQNPTVMRLRAGAGQRPGWLQSSTSIRDEI